MLTALTSRAFESKVRKGENACNKIDFQIQFILLSANASILDKPKALLFGEELIWVNSLPNDNFRFVQIHKYFQYNYILIYYSKQFKGQSVFILKFQVSYLCTISWKKC